MDTNEAFCDTPPSCEEWFGRRRHFYAKDGDYTLELNVFRDDESGYVSYEIKENDDYLAYGNVNEGDVEDATGMRRRRRLLKVGTTGGS